jgi:anti-sigma regulatory factor (Ser/Thr protein kinase)
MAIVEQPERTPMSDGFTTRLTLPALARYGRVARLAAAGVAAEAGLSVDDVEDLRTAVNELFSLLVEDAPSEDDLVELVLVEIERGTIEVTGHRQVSHADPSSEPEPDDLTREILSVVVDDFELDTSGDVRRFQLRKSARIAPAGEEQTIP